MRNVPLRRSAIRRRGPRNPIPLSVRAAVLARCQNQCERCGRVETLHLHHRLKRSQGGTHTDTNLVALCSACHSDVEAHPAQAVAEGFSLQLGKAS